MTATRAEATLQRLLARQSPVHAVLLYGAPGAPLDALARHLAQGWMCRQPADDGAGCGLCPVCRTVAEGRAIDLLEIRPSGPSRLIRAEQIEERPGTKSDAVPLSRFVLTLPTQARRKVVWLVDADRLNATSFNAILKTLEEPEPHLRFILTTTSVGQLPATIVSRCLGVACASPAIPEQDDPLVQLYGAGSAHGPASIVAQREAYANLHQLWETLPGTPLSNALRLADAFRVAAERLSSDVHGGTRGCHAEGLRTLAVWLRHTLPHAPHALAPVLEAHRRVVGNGAVNLQADAMFAALIPRLSRPTGRSSG